MKKLICLLLFAGLTVFGYAQKSTGHFCNYKGKDTEMKGDGRGDTNLIVYKGQNVGYIACEKIKLKKGFMFQNNIFDLNMNKIAMVGNETGQFYIKYANPFKMVYVSGYKFDYVMKQMVEVDKKLVFNP